MMDNKNIKEQAQYIWNRLDDLALTDPSAYKKFIDEQMKERELFNSPPQPRLCFVVQTKEGQDWFVNICSWKRIPYPKDDTEPLKFMCGYRQQHTDSNSYVYVTVPVAANDKVLDELLKSPFDKVELLKLIIKFVMNEQKIQLKESFKLCKDLYKGTLLADPRRLFIKNPNLEFDEASIRHLLSKNFKISDSMSSPQSLIKSLSGEENNENENLTLHHDCVEKFIKGNQTSSKKLVQEVENILKKPEYSLTDDKKGNLVLKITLSGIESAAECDLTITQSLVELEIPNAYSLKVDLPNSIDDESAKAKFSKKSSTLILTMPLLLK